MRPACQPPIPSSSLTFHWLLLKVQIQYANPRHSLASLAYDMACLPRDTRTKIGFTNLGLTSPRARSPRRVLGCQGVWSAATLPTIRVENWASNSGLCCRATAQPAHEWFWCTRSVPQEWRNAAPTRMVWRSVWSCDGHQAGIFQGRILQESWTGMFYKSITGECDTWVKKCSTRGLAEISLPYLCVRASWFPYVSIFPSPSANLISVLFWYAFLLCFCLNPSETLQDAQVSRKCSKMS